MDFIELVTVVQVRDKRFIAQHRGGSLTQQQHYMLMMWAIRCAEHVLIYYSQPLDPQLSKALKTAKDWIHGNASVNDAKQAAYNIITLVKQLSDPTAVLVARSIGQAVATAHMADHSLGAAWYALKVIKSAGCSVEAELLWQNKHLTPQIKELVLSARTAPKFKI